jgi:hypothetical protein
MNNQKISQHILSDWNTYHCYLFLSAKSALQSCFRCRTISALRDLALGCNFLGGAYTFAAILGSSDSLQHHDKRPTSNLLLCPSFFDENFYSHAVIGLWSIRDCWKASNLYTGPTKSHSQGTFSKPTRKQGSATAQLAHSLPLGVWGNQGQPATQ